MNSDKLSTAASSAANVAANVLSKVRGAVTAASPFLAVAGGVLGLSFVALGAVSAFSAAYKPSQPPADGIYKPPAPSLWRSLSLYTRVYSVRGIGTLLNLLLLPKPRPTVHLPAHSPAGNPCELMLWYPEGYSGPEARGDDKPAPVVYINAHGGGFIAGKLGDDEEFCRLLASPLSAGGAGAVVVSVGYRLAPEFPAPIAAFDVARTAAWAASYFKASRIVLGGFSAGGSLALAASAYLTAADKGPYSLSAFPAPLHKHFPAEPVKLPEGAHIAAVAAFFPPVDVSADAPHEFEDKDPFGKMIYYEAYLNWGGLRSDDPDLLPSLPAHPLVSPGKAPPEDFPNKVLLIIGGMAEPNRPNIEALASALYQTNANQGARTGAGAEAGAGAGAGAVKRSVSTLVYPQVPHGWPHLPEAVLAKLGTPKEQGGQGTGVDAKRQAFEAVVALVRAC
jgi:acetyl esterase/lipase